MRRVLAVLAFAFLAGPPPEAARAAAPLEVRSGGLTARVQADPWRVSFTDARGRTVLEEGLGPAGRPGPVSFRTALGWARARRVLAARREGGALVLRVATSDPLGRQLAVRLAPAGAGVLSLRAAVAGSAFGITGYGAGFRAHAGERFWGLGERADAVDHRGRTVEGYVSDGPYQPEERPAVAAFVPAPGLRLREDATYYPLPWLLSSRGFGVQADTSYTTYHRLDGDVWSVEATGAPDGAVAESQPKGLDLRVFAGPTPARALRRFTAHTGRQPRVAAPWVFGPWFQPGGSTAEQAEQVRRLRRADAPVSVAQTYLHYLPCGDQQGRREEERARVRSLRALGVATTTYFNPMVCTSYRPVYDEAARAGALTRDRTGRPYTYRYTGSTVFAVSQLDFSSPAGRGLWHRLLGEAVADGHQGWMEDFGEYTPLDSRDAAGRDGSASHNAYPVEYHCSAWDFARARALRGRVVRFQRSGWTGAARCAQVVWSGDPTTSWGFDGLTSQVRAALGMGLSGVSRWGSDIGGFFALGANRLDPELLTRWVQFGAVSGVMRTQRNGFDLPAKERPQVEDAGQLANWKRYAKLRTRLYPYVRAADAGYRRTGLPIMRHLGLAFPGDARATAREDEFLFGPDLLAAPVTRPGARTQPAYLPAGRWVDLWRSARWVAKPGRLALRRAKVLRGGREASLPAPLAELPLLVRAGAVLPLLPSDVDTLASPGRGRGLVHLAERRGRLTLLAFPRGRRTAPMFERERLRSVEGRRSWALAIRGARRRAYSLEASLRTLRRPFRPRRVTFAGRRVPFRYDRRTGVLRARFSARRGTLVVR